MRADGPGATSHLTLAYLQAWSQRSLWHHRSAAFAAGVASVLSMAPFFLWPILWLTLPALLWLLGDAAERAPTVSRLAPWQRSAPGRAAETGWWFGFGYHIAGLFWIGEAFLIEAEVFAWLLPFAVTLLPAGLALFTAAACGFATWAAPSGIARVLALALGFGITEWLRGHIFTGFPWNILGYALTAPGLLQGAATFGIYGLTVIAVLSFTAPATLWAMHRRTLAIAVAVLPIAVFAVDTLAASVKAAAPSTLGPTIRIVQPNIQQREKWRPENQRAVFDRHLALSLTNPKGEVDNAQGINLIVWPEAAMPFFPLAEPLALSAIGQMLPPQATLVTGALRSEPALSAGSPRRVFNSLLVFGAGPSAPLRATYDKTHLVPFGEYLPLQSVLEAVGLQQLSRLRGGFAEGPEPRALIEIPDVGRLAPLICYEAIFPGRVVQTRERPRAIVNVTNDGWFGNTTGPRQHFHMARVRAVEEGLPVIRSANNGISAVIDPYGNIHGVSLGMNVGGTIDASLPPTIAPPFYARHGDLAFALLCSALALAVIRLRRRHAH